jgi:hypothetical protein
MGVDVSAKLVIGIEVTRTTFFVTSDTIEHNCPNGHAPKEGAKFCDQDGLPFHRDVRIEKATPDFEAWAKKLDYEDPAKLWEDLEAERVSGTRGLGIFAVGGVESSNYDSTHTALGFEIMDQDGAARGGSHGRNSVNTLGLPELQEKGALLTDLAKELGLESFLPVKLMLTVYWS